MIRATYRDKDCAVSILARSFDDNKSINYIIKQDKKRDERIKRLMDYSFDVCYLFGEIFLSDDRQACALIVYPDKKAATLKSILLDIQLILKSVGLKNIRKILNREALIKKVQPKVLMTYLWFIGVDPKCQNIGKGSNLLNEIIKYSSQKNRPIYLETSTLKNIPWYKYFGFTIYNELDFGYKLFFLKREMGK